MTDESSEDSHLLLKDVESLFTPAYGGQVIHEALDDINRRMTANTRSMQRLLPYLTGLYYEDRQRQMAEAHLYRIQTEQGELFEELHNTLMIVGHLHRPVSITHT